MRSAAFCSRLAWHLPLMALRFYLGIGCFLWAPSRCPARDEITWEVHARAALRQRMVAMPQELAAAQPRPFMTHPRLVGSVRPATLASAMQQLSSPHVDSVTRPTRSGSGSTPLFKQAESGDAPVKGPSRLNAVAFAKWQEGREARARSRGRTRAVR